MKFENTEVWGFEHALRGMRNPYNSWNKSDSGLKRWCSDENEYVDAPCGYDACCHSCNFVSDFVVGEKDLELAQKLIKAGSEHRKFLRQIFVSVDITAPQYFFAELDTYKIGVTRNSTSMQHRGVSHRYTIDDFEVDEKIREVLSERENNYSDLFYPYETNEFKIYETENGRKYEIYKNGRIFALPFCYVDSKGRKREFAKREIIPSKNRSGYFELNLGGRNNESWLLHRLIAYCWIDNPNSFKTIDHKDRNRANNSVENLEWVSIEENVRREWENHKGFDLQKCYKNWKASSKINPVKKLQIIELYSKGISQKEIAEKYGISQCQVSSILLNRNNTSENRELFEHCWYWEQMLMNLNILRDKYLETKDYEYFRLIRQLMPMGYLYKSTITMNYENLLSMVKQRKNHKLTEWSVKFVEWVKSLPYANELIFGEENGEC